MSTSGVEDAIENHGTAIDKEKSRVKCKYCAKEVRGFNRLKHHLGGVGTDVVACIQVPADVKVCMRDALLNKKKERLLKEVGELYHPDLPLKRKISTPPIEPRHCPTLPFNPANVTLAPDNAFQGRSNGNASGFRAEPSQPKLPISSGKEKRTTKAASREDGVNGNRSAPMFFMAEEVHTVVKEEVKEEEAKEEEVKDDSVLVAARCIGRFFFEAGIDLAGIKLPSFQKMIDAAITCGAGFKVPKFDELRGWVLQQDMKEVQEHVEDVKCSWGRTGCSILLDGWIDQKGRSLISFLVNCPQGTIFLKSVDASDAVTDVDALFLLLSRVIEDVGVENVVQIIAHETSCYMEAARKKLVEKYRNIFWTLCADHCINLILERVAMMDHVKKVLTEAKAITKFIYSHALPLELMRKHVQGSELVRTSKLESVGPFITLENLVTEKENLIHMFNSPTWRKSIWASRAKGKNISELVYDPSFWATAADILKVTNPLVGVLHQINQSDTAPMGFLYDTMDRAKETIKRNLGSEEANYLPFWIIIDEIWDNYLHSPLHSAGYYLNPSLFYSNDFFIDAEVANGLLSCIVRMAENQQHQEMIVLQLDAYRAALGGFAEKMAIEQRSTIPPVSWWSLHGVQSLELQRLAIKILSQTCSTAPRYKLQKSLSEQLHAKRRNFVEQQSFSDMEFVHNNLHLWHSHSREQEAVFGAEEFNPMDDWTTGG